MNIFLDGLILVILVLFTIIGVRKGLIRSVINLLGTVFSAYFSGIAAKACAQWIYTSMIKQSIISSVSDSLTASAGEGALSTVNDIIESLPDFIKAIVPNAEASTQLQDALNSGINSIASAVEQLVSPVVTAILSIALTVVLFVLFMVLVRFISRAVTRVCRIPVLFGVNRTLGGILGLLKGVVLIMLAVSLLRLLSDFGASNQQTIDNTYLFKLFYNFNIFSFMFR